MEPKPIRSRSWLRIGNEIAENTAACFNQSGHFFRWPSFISVSSALKETTVRLSAVPDDCSWSSRTWQDFARAKNQTRRLVVLPLFGFADWGLGRSIDLEETLGTAVLQQALARWPARANTPLILPPLRFVLGPYSHTLFGIDFETAVELVREIGASVHAAGFQRLALFNTSPWNEELINAAGRDLRVEFGLQVFLVNLGALGLDLHPVRSPDRDVVQCAACACTGALPAREKSAGRISLPEFRPGHIQQPPPLAFRRKLPDAIEEGQGHLAAAGERLASLFGEMAGPWRRSRSREANEVSPNLWPAYRSRYLPALSCGQINALPRSARRSGIVIIPTGAIEQHGPHLPVGVDALLGQAWLEATLPLLPKQAPVFVGPAITYGKSNEHLGFPGTVTIGGRTLHRLLLNIARQVHALGFRTLAVLNTHGGNSAVVVATLREIQNAVGLNAVMVGTKWRPQLSVEEARFGFHAGRFETALMRVVAPHLVRMKAAVREFPARSNDPGEIRPENAPVTFSWMTADISRSGVMGDATIATASDGRTWLREGGRALADEIQELLHRLRSS